MWQGTTDDGCVALADLLGWKVTALGHAYVTPHLILRGNACSMQAFS